jgi:hypothetical protein
MTPINLEMIKQLLQEFVDKEAVTTAEINVVQQQIQELDSRVEKCKEKLKIISGDKEKIVAMTKRYTSLLNAPSLNNQASATVLQGEPAQSAEAVGALADEQAQTRKDPLAPHSQSAQLSETITGDHPALPANASLNFQASKANRPKRSTMSNIGAIKQTEPAKTESVRLERALSESGKAESAGTELTKNEPTKTDASKTGPTATESTIPEPAKTEPTIIEPARLEPETPQLASDPASGVPITETKEPAIDESDKKSDSLKESVDDTVKSINDALRGLFR